ncbi:MAG: hypothetical protein COA88_03330 [Kordia sp.]|nr:MAG: hypothetical protein COA88_03330 [Kordia sp.]
MIKFKKTSIHKYTLKTRILPILILLFIQLNSYSQENVTDDFIKENNYLNNSLQEKYFLHTNKTVYFPGEHIWFKAYVVYDIEDTPYYKTTNLHVNLYNSEKKLINNQLFFVENGITSGSIKLPENTIAGKYYIELTTQWNKNFKNLNITQIKVLSSESNISKTFVEKHETKSKNDLNIQFFPESNVLLEGAENLILFKTNITNTDSITIKGKIIDNVTLREVATIRDTINGIGVFKLIYHPKRNYTAFIEVNGIKKQVLIPKAKQKGFIIQQKRKHLNKNAIPFCIKSNKLTIQEKVNQTIFVAIHRKNYLKSVLPINVDQQYHNYNFELEEGNLFNGVNTITIFDEKNIPISSRTFYYNKENKQIDLEITTVNKTNDSITLNINMLNKYIESNLSISVLPTETKMNSNSNNIINSFLISPYINRNTPIDSKIFNNDVSKNDINVLLQTYPNEKPQKKSILKFSPENGVSIKGSVNSNITSLATYKVMLSSKTNNLLVVSEIKNRTFEFNNLLLKHPTKYKLALISNTGEVIKSSFNVSKKYTKYKADGILKYNVPSIAENKVAIENINLSKSISITNDNQLDEVVINTKKETSDLKDLLPNPKVLGGSFTKSIDIHKNIDKGDSNVLELINGLAGVDVSLYAQGEPVIKSTRGPKTFYAANDAENVKVILNGMPLSDISVLSDIKANDVEDIKLNASGAGFGLRGTNGVIFINTKRGGDIKSIKNTGELNNILCDTEFGFSFNEVNYEGFELNFINQKFNSFYNTINWFPNIIIKPNTANQLKFDTKGFKNIKLIINGMNNKGDITHQILYITN